MMGAIAFQKGLGVTHSCAHALGTALDMHHGLANAVMIDHALKINVPAVGDRFTTMAMTVGIKNPTPAAFMEWLANLKRDSGIPGNLTEYGAKKELIPKLTELAFQDSCHQNNPRPCTQEDFRKIFTEAF